MEYTYNIIDSDAASKLQLQLYLEEYEDLVCAGVETTASTGLNSILKYNPDLVLINLGEDDPGLLLGSELACSTSNPD